jgi:hypothetical protein
MNELTLKFLNHLGHCTENERFQCSTFFIFFFAFISNLIYNIQRKLFFTLSLGNLKLDPVEARGHIYMHKMLM